jgi:hypothetical protein
VANATTAATRARASTGSSAFSAGGATTIAATRLAKTSQPNVRKALPADPAGSAVKVLEAKHIAELQNKRTEIERLQTERETFEGKASVRGS